MEKFNFLEFIINALLASFGGLVRRLAEMENKKNDPRKMSLFYYIVGCAISMFVGVVIYLLCKNFGVSQYLTAGSNPRFIIKYSCEKSKRCCRISR